MNDAFVLRALIFHLPPSLASRSRADTASS